MRRRLILKLILKLVNIATVKHKKRALNRIYYHVHKQKMCLQKREKSMPLTVMVQRWFLVTLAMTSIPHWHSKVEFHNGKDDHSRFPYVLVDGSCSSLYVYSVLSGG